MRKYILIGILFLGLAEFGYGAWTPVKAWLSQVLLANAWQASLQDGQSHKPWSWADTWPVLDLEHEASGTRLLVLQGDAGQALAFGPGLASMSSMPGKSGNTVISAHRDTHFDFLEQANIGDIIILRDGTGEKHRYELVTTEIVDSRTAYLQIDTHDDRLTLVTCYPFNQIAAGGPLRYVVTGFRTG